MDYETKSSSYGSVAVVDSELEAHWIVVGIVIPDANAGAKLFTLTKLRKTQERQRDANKFYDHLL
jgi:hypothetical protein